MKSCMCVLFFVLTKSCHHKNTEEQLGFFCTWKVFETTLQSYWVRLPLSVNRSLRICTIFKSALVRMPLQYCGHFLKGWNMPKIIINCTRRNWTCKAKISELTDFQKHTMKFCLSQKHSHLVNVLKIECLFPLQTYHHYYFLIQSILVPVPCFRKSLITLRAQYSITQYYWPLISSSKTHVPTWY